MIKLNVTLSQQADLGMPLSGTAHVASVRALPAMGVVSAGAAASKRDRFDATPVSGYRCIQGVDVFTGTVPGTSAWSPPI